MALGNGSTQNTTANGGVVAQEKAPVVNGTNMETLPRPTKQQDPNTAFLRAARAGELEKIQEYLDSGTVRDINTSNTNGLNALHLAAKDGHVKVVQELLKRGAIVDAATKKGNTALHIASLAGQEEVVRLLIHHGASINVQSQNGFTPLYMASQENHDGCVKYLLAKGGNQTLATEDGFTPLAVAMQQGHDKVVAVLLENDSRGKVRLPALHIAAKKDDCKAAAFLLKNDHNPDVTSKSGFTPLHIAAHYGNDEVASLLCDRGAAVNFTAKHNITPLHVASKWGRMNMVSLLIAKGADIQAKTRDGLTPLHCAARSGHDQVVDTLLMNGAPMHSKTKNGLAPLHMAAQGEHVDAARILLYHKAPVDEVTVDYLTALHVAAHCGHVRVAKLLLDRGADPNARALNGFTPLHIACKKNRIKMVELLLKHGASIGATTESGLTPLHVASFMGCMNIVIFLLQNEASPDIPTVRGETPLHLAARANQTDIIRILLRNDAAVDAKAREEQTPLHVAARLGNVDIVMLLLQHGANPQATTKDLYTPLHIAAKEGQEEVASVLLDHGANLEATTKKGFTPLHLASKYGFLNVARLLLQRDAVRDAQGKNGVTPLHVAAHYDHQPLALLLLDKGASPLATAKNGHTPLHIAAKKNQMDIATTLLEYGALANSESKDGFTPLHLSAQEGHSDMSSLLLEHQADPNHASKNGLTPLHHCAQEDRVAVAQLLLRAGAKKDCHTKTGYTPLHMACHYGHIGMVRLLVEQGADVNPTTGAGYTPLHQAAQQGHVLIISLLLKHRADPNAVTNNGQTALGIANKLGYISVVEELKVVTEVDITTTTTVNIEEKYKVVAPEAMQETFMSDSEDEGGGGVDEHPVAYGRPAHAQHVYLPFYQGQMSYTRDDTLADQQQYKYMTVDDMKSLGDDSMRMDVTNDEKSGDYRSSMAPSHVSDFIISPHHVKEYYATNTSYTVPDNIDINRTPITVGKLPSWRNFLVSFLVDARGGAMRGCRHSGVRVIVPPRCASSPTRITCRYVRPKKMLHPPPLMEGEALASRVLELGPVAAKFLGPVIIEVPHFASLRGKQREIIILRSDNGETWKEHTLDNSEEAIQDVLNHSFEGEELSQIEDLHTNRITRILTNDFPHFFAVVSRVRQEVHAIGPEGGTVSSSAVPMVQAVFPPNALTKKIRVGLQAQAMEPELVSKLLGHGVAVSPIVTVEPRRRKFHKAITLSLPAPRAHSQGMINQYSGSAPTLRLLCSITGGQSKAVWEDVTGSTPLTFVKDCVSFTTTVSARFWLMDCRNFSDSARMSTELYTQAAHVPFMAKFVVFAKRISQLEARVRVFCMTDDKEDKTLEHQEHFTEIAKSKDVEVLEGKVVYMEFAGNLVPILQSGDQPMLDFKAFRENRLAFTMRLKDHDEEPVGRIVFMNDPKVARGEPTQTPLCTLNLVLPKDILPGRDSQSDLLALDKDHSYLQHGGISTPDTIHRADFRLSDICELLGDDWVKLSENLDIPPSDVAIIEDQYPDGESSQRAMVMLRLWLRQKAHLATGNALEVALKKIGREDIVNKCICNVELVTDDVEQAVARVHLDQTGFDELREELGPRSRDASLRRDAKLEVFNGNNDDGSLTIEAQPANMQEDDTADMSLDDLSERNDDNMDHSTDKDLTDTFSEYVISSHKVPLVETIITTITTEPIEPIIERTTIEVRQTNGNDEINRENDNAAIAEITEQLTLMQTIPKSTGDKNGNTPPPSPAVFNLDNEKHVFNNQRQPVDEVEIHKKGAPASTAPTAVVGGGSADFIQHETTCTAVETAPPTTLATASSPTTSTVAAAAVIATTGAVIATTAGNENDTSEECDLTSMERELVAADPIADLKRNVIDTLTFLHQERNDFLPQEDVIVPSRKDDHIANDIDLSVITPRKLEAVSFALEFEDQPVRVEDVIETARSEITQVIEQAEQTVNDRVSTEDLLSAQIKSEEAFKFLENEIAASSPSPATVFENAVDPIEQYLRNNEVTSRIPVPATRSGRRTSSSEEREDDCTSPPSEAEIISKIPVTKGKVKTIKKHSKDPLKEFVKLSQDVNWDENEHVDPIVKTTVTRITTTTTSSSNDVIDGDEDSIATSPVISKIPVLNPDAASSTTTTVITTTTTTGGDTITSPNRSKIPILLTETTRIVSPDLLIGNNNGTLISPGSRASKSSTLDDDSDDEVSDTDENSRRSSPPLKSILKKRSHKGGSTTNSSGGTIATGGGSGGSFGGGGVGSVGSSGPGSIGGRTSSRGGLRTIGSSSGSDVALHEAGAEPSDDESDDFCQIEPHFTESTIEEIDPVTGAKVIRTVRTLSQTIMSPDSITDDDLHVSMQAAMDRFMTEERQQQ